MSESIAGYIDKSYIKGQYYRYAASPKPVVFTGNIDTVSDDLLCKAMLANKGVASGTFPTDAGSSFLITTEKYGDDIYLQVAYLLLSASGFNCYEYRRVYTNSAWTDWISTDADIASMDSRIQEAKDSADNCAAGLQATTSQVSDLNSKVNVLNNQTVPNLTNSVSSLSSRLGTVESRTTNCGKIPVIVYTGAISSGDSYTIRGVFNIYSQYLVVAKVQNISGASIVNQLVLKNQIFTTDTSFCISDEVYYLSYYLRHSGNDLIVTGRADNRDGYIQQIYGIY